LRKTILGNQSGQDGMEYVALAALILIAVVAASAMIAAKITEGASRATSW